MLQFFGVSKEYKKGNGDSFYALKDFNYAFDKNGMYCILGKSGSGKSTIANLGALLDYPTSGSITYAGQDISKFKEKEINNYRCKVVTTIFQHYNLLANLTVIENIIVPRLALQEDEKIARQDAINLLKELGFAAEFGEKKCKDLSGGEAQRVAILRAIINNPQIIIADEPTGALDENNSILIMKLLKKLSLKKIVIVITHNNKLAKEFGDEILNLKDGQLIDTEVRRKREQVPLVKLKPDKKLGKHCKWLYRFAFKRLSKNKAKNALSCISIIVGLLSVFLIIGFSYGSNNVVNIKTKERLDYGVAEISKTETIELEGSMLNLSKMTRLKNEELNLITNQYPFLTTDINFDSLFSNTIYKMNGKEINGLSLEFIYKFDDDYLNKDLINKGDINKENGIIINEQAESLFKEKLNLTSILGRDIVLSSRYELNTTIDDDVIQDEFKFNDSFKILGVSKEFSFLAVPKVYLSYSYIKSLLEMDIIKNLSSVKESEITWYDYISHASDSDEITSFSHKIFIKNADLNIYEALIDAYQDSDITIDSQPYLLKTTFISLLHSVKIGLIIFSSLAIFGTVLIIGINAFSSYTFEKKNSAIYFAFGVSRSQIFTIFIIETIFITLFAFMISVIGAFGLEKLINLIIGNSFGINNIVAIPFARFHGAPLLLIFAGLIFSLMTCIIFTYIPLLCAKKINLKKELSDE